MEPPDVTTDPAEWEQVQTRYPLWKNLVHQDVYSNDGGKTYTISTERVSPDIPRTVRQSRRV